MTNKQEFEKYLEDNKKVIGRYRYENGFGEYSKWEMELAYLAGCKMERERCARLADEEPCYPNEPPKLCENIETVLSYPNPEKGVLLLCQLAAKQTKQCIARKIRGEK